MNDLLLYLTLVLGTYFCGMGFVIVMFRLFFPLKTKEEWQKIDANAVKPAYQRVSRMKKVQNTINSRSGQLASSHGS